MTWKTVFVPVIDKLTAIPVLTSVFLIAGRTEEHVLTEHLRAA